MKLLLTGACGFAASTLALALQEATDGLELIGVDNFIRPGSELNRQRLRDRGMDLRHADLRCAEDLADLPAVDWVIDAAANPSVLAGVAGSGSGSQQLMRHNLDGTVHLLEYCRRTGAGFVLLSTSRVYSIAPLAELPLEVREGAFRPTREAALPVGLGPGGIREEFSTAPPLSLYGASKLCSEILAREYGAAFEFPVWINRLGVLAGAGQFGRADQGIFSFWIHSCAQRRPLKFTGFGGQGHQVRDCLHPRDLRPVLLEQFKTTPRAGAETLNFAGGGPNSMSLLQLHQWCEDRFGSCPVEGDPRERPFDVPWMILDAGKARERFGWQPTAPLAEILTEIAEHAEQNPRWLEITCPT